MALDAYKYNPNEKDQITGDRLCFIDDRRFRDFRDFFETLNSKAGIVFDPYSDLIIRSGNFEPIISSLKIAIDKQKNVQIKGELLEFLSVFQKAQEEGYGIIFLGD